MPENGTIRERVSKYQKLFGLDNWTIDAGFKFDLAANAKTMADPRYYKATISFKDQNQPDEIIVHEMIHIVMAKYDFYVDNFTDFSKLPTEAADNLYFIERESSVSQMTKIMMRLIKQNE
jgi:hypothetical protein